MTGKMVDHRCPSCGGRQFLITDSRPLVSQEQPIIRRRKRCECGHRWTTYEITQEAYFAICDSSAKVGRVFARMPRAARVERSA